MTKEYIIKANSFVGYQECIEAGATVKMEAFAVDGMLEYRSDGEHFKHLISDECLEKNKPKVRKILQDTKHEVSLEIEKLSVQKLREASRYIRDPGLLVIASDKNAARTLAKNYETKHGLEVVTLTEDTPNPTETLRKFNEGEGSVLMTVDKGGEGLNSPRLFVGRWASNKMTSLYNQQGFCRLGRRYGNSNYHGTWIMANYAPLTNNFSQLGKITTIKVDDDITAKVSKGSQKTDTPTDQFIPIDVSLSDVSGICGELKVTEDMLRSVGPIRSKNKELWAGMPDTQVAMINAELNPNFEPLPKSDRILTHDETNKRLRNTAHDLANRLAKKLKVEPREVNNAWLQMGNPRHAFASNEELRAKIRWLIEKLEDNDFKFLPRNFDRPDVQAPF